MLAGAGCACRRYPIEQEVHAVQGEICLPPDALEGILSTLGLRVGLFDADAAYTEAFRRMELGDGRAMVGDGSRNLNRLTPHPFPLSSKWIEPGRPTYSNANTDAPIATGQTFGAAAEPPSSDGAGRLAAVPSMPPFTLSWQQPTAADGRGLAAELPGSAVGAGRHVPSERAPEVGAVSPATDCVGAAVPRSDGERGAPAAAATDSGAAGNGAAAARPDPHPAAPRHLGLGIMVRADYQKARPAVEQPEARAPRGGAGADSGQPGELTGGGDGGRPGSRGPGQLSFPPLSGSQALQHCAELFGPHRQRARQGSGPRRVSEVFGGPLPTWYTRSPGLSAGDLTPLEATAAAANEQPQQQHLGKRPRETYPEDATTGFSGAGAGGDTEDKSEVLPSHQRLRMLETAAEGPAAAGWGRGGLGPGTAGVLPSDQRCMAPGPLQRTCDPAAVPQPREPLPEAAPFGELLYGVQRMGSDLCRRARDPALGGGDSAVWRSAWVRVLLRLLDQMRRLLDARSAVTKYVGADRSLDPAQSPSQPPLRNHSQLRAAVQLLLLAATELPDGKPPRCGVAPEALDAVDYLLCSSPFADFDGCDPQARAVLVDGALRLARLAAERAAAGARAGREPPGGGWGGVRDRALQTLTGWLVRQGDVIRQLSAPAFDFPAGSNLGGLRWDSWARGALPDESRLWARRELLRGHVQLFHLLCTSLAALALCLGPPLAQKLLEPELVASLMPSTSATSVNLRNSSATGLLGAFPAGGSAAAMSLPGATSSSSTLLSGTREPQRADAAVLLHAALLALVGPDPAGGGAGGCLGESCEVLLRSGLRGAAEQLLLSEARSADQLLLLPGREASEAQESRGCRDAVVPLLGSVYALLLLVGQGCLGGWAAVEAAIHAAATEGCTAPSASPCCPLRKAWNGAADRRYLGLSLYLLAQVLRALSWLGARKGLQHQQQQQLLLAAALRCDPPRPGPGTGGVQGPVRLPAQQLGLIGVWLRAALDCSGRPLLAALTAEMLRCDRLRRLFGFRSQASGTASPAGAAAAAVAGACADDDTAEGGDGGDVEAEANAVALAITADVDGSTCARLAAALVSGLLRERRAGDVRAALCGLELTWRALRQDLPRAAPGPGLPAGVGAAAAAAAAAMHGGGGSTQSGGVPGPGVGGPPACTLAAHHAMSSVALAALEPLGVGWGAGQAGGFGSCAGMGDGSAARSVRLEQQGPVRVLECVAEVVLDDTAALMRWGTVPAGSSGDTPSPWQCPPAAAAAELVSSWAARLRCPGSCSAGLLPDLAAVLARCIDCRADIGADLSASPGGHSVLQRCLATLCLLVSELPPAGEAHVAANTLLREYVAAAVMNHLRAPPLLQPAANPEDQPGLAGAVQGWGPSWGWEVAAAQANLGRMLHRCVAGCVRHYVAEGLRVAVPQSAQARHAVNALAWLRCLLRHPAMRQRALLERLLPPLLTLVVEGAAAARGLLLTRAVLHFDAEAPDAGQPPQPPHQHPPPLGLIRELLDTAGEVLAAAAGAKLLATREEAYSTAPGSVRIDASPLLLMEPAPRNQIRAAAGFAAALLLRICLECFALPLEPPQQRLLLAAARPPEEERCLRVRQRLASWFGTPPALAEAERPKAVRHACGQDALKLSAAPAAMDGADGAVKLSEAAIGCVLRTVLALDVAGQSWAPPVVAGLRQLIREATAQSLRFTDTQRAALVQLLRGQRGRGALQQPSGSAVLQEHRQQQRQQQRQQPPAQPPQGRQSQPQPAPKSHSEPQPGRGDAQRSCEDLRSSVSPKGSAAAAAAAVKHWQAGREEGSQPGFPPPSSSAQRATSPLMAASQATRERLQHRASLRSAAAAPVPSPSTSSSPSNRPLAHYVAALSVDRWEDHRVRLTGCVPFADLRTLLLPGGATAGGQQQQQHPGAAAMLQAGVGTPGKGAAPTQQTDLPPVVGEVVEATLLLVKNGTTRVLQLALRDASMALAKAMIIYVAGPQEALVMLLTELKGRRVLVGFYGAVFLGEASGGRKAAGIGAGDDRPPRPMLARMSLDVSASRTTACGLVIEPRTVYAAQLQLALRAQDHRGAAPTVAAATLAAAAGAVRASFEVGPSQVSSAVFPAALPVPVGGAMLFASDGGLPTGAVVPQLASNGERHDVPPPAVHAQRWDAMASSSVPESCSDVADAAAGRLTAAATTAAALSVESGPALVHAASGTFTSQDAQGRASAARSAYLGGTDGKAAGSSTATRLEPVDLAWRGLLAASRCISGGPEEKTATTEYGAAAAIERQSLKGMRGGDGTEEALDKGCGFVPATQLCDGNG